jgi:hypothetical protein
MLPGPERREFDVLAKLGLTKRAVQLFRVPVAHRRRRRVSIQLDRLFSGFTERPKCFGHDDLLKRWWELL